MVPRPEGFISRLAAAATSLGNAIRKVPSIRPEMRECSSTISVPSFRQSPGDGGGTSLAAANQASRVRIAPSEKNKSQKEIYAMNHGHVLAGKKIAILATEGFEQSELEKPRQALDDAGAKTELVSPASGSIRGWNRDDFGDVVGSMWTSPRPIPTTTTACFCPAV
jgi:hypothetical protein